MNLLNQVTVVVLVIGVHLFGLDGTFASALLPFDAESTLELVQILYRHGDRTPHGIYPTDPYAAFWTDQGLGQLTKLGKQQHLELGSFIRQRYSSFLNATYDGREVIVRSTDYDRTLMSAQVNLAGLYPPSGTQVWNDSIHWQPIPVHTVPLAVDYLLYVGYENCPAYRELTDELMNSTEVKNIIRDNKDLMELLTNMTGESVHSLRTIGDIFDIIFIEKTNKMKLPSWVTDAVYERLRKLDLLDFDYLVKTDEQIRLFGGPLLKEMLTNVKRKIDEPANPMQLYAYSAHDTTVEALLSVLGIYNQLPPPYACAVFVELHRLPNSTYALQFLYRNTTTDDPHVLTVPNCTALCPLNRVVELTANRIPDDIVRECQSSSSASKFPLTIAIVTGVMTAVFVVALIFGFLCWRKRKRAADGNYRYTIVNED